MKLTAIVVLLLVLVQFGPAPAYTAPGAEQSFVLFYSNDVVGETEPCG